MKGLLKWVHPLAMSKAEDLSALGLSVLGHPEEMASGPGLRSTPFPQDLGPPGATLQALERAHL